jgi:hypothetical protein
MPRFPDSILRMQWEWVLHNGTMQSFILLMWKWRGHKDLGLTLSTTSINKQIKLSSLPSYTYRSFGSPLSTPWKVVYTADAQQKETCSNWKWWLLLSHRHEQEGKR